MGKQKTSRERATLLTATEKEWWNSYHAQVRDVLAPQLEGDVLAWLEEVCRPL